MTTSSGVTAKAVSSEPADDAIARTQSGLGCDEDGPAIDEGSATAMDVLNFSNSSPRM